MQHRLLHARAPTPCKHRHRAACQRTHAYTRSSSAHGKVQQQLQELLSCPDEQLPSRIADVAALVKQLADKLQASPDWSMQRSSMRQMEARYNADKQHSSSKTAASLDAAQQWSWSAVTRLTVLGLGSISACKSESAQGAAAASKRAAFRLHQLALCLSLMQVLPGLQQPPTFADPAFNSWDEAFIRALGGTIMPSNELSSIAVPTTCSNDGRTISPVSSSSEPQNSSSSNCSTESPVMSSSKSQNRGGSSSSKIKMTSGQQAGSTQSNSQQPIGSSGSRNSSGGGEGSSSHAGSSSSSTGRASNSSSSSSTGSTTRQPAELMLLYMPCCPRTLYADVVAANLHAGTLSQVAILGNSFRTLADSNILLQALMRQAGPQAAIAASTSGQHMPASFMGGVASPASALGLVAGMADQQEDDEEGPTPEVLLRLVSKKAYLELPVPDCAAHGVAVGLHAFPPSRLLQLQQ